MRRPAADQKFFAETMIEGGNMPTYGRSPADMEFEIVSQSGLQIVYRSLRELIPYAGNARTHSDEQLRKIRASLKRFGWTNPMLIAGNDLLAGHARLQVALQMAEENDPIPRNPDPWMGPTVDLSDLGPEDRRAYILADNRIALDAGWDEEILRAEFLALEASEYDLAATGFDDKEITEYLIDTSAPGEKEDRVLTASENDMLDVAWHKLITEWAGIIATAQNREWLTTGFTKGMLAVQYLRSLFLGDEIPRGATLAYTPHRIFCEAGSQGAIADVFAEAMKGEAGIPAEGRGTPRTLRDSIRFISQERPSLDKIIGGSSLPIHRFRLPNDFPAHLARDLIDEFSPNMGSHILDPCHGWGGRMLGFLLSERASYYHGIDPAPETCNGVRAMFGDLSALTPVRAKVAKLDCCPFEEAVLEPEGYDFALTSPPYFDTERYPGEKSSWRTYSTIDEWFEGFYRTLLSKTATALRHRGIFALQVGSQTYPLTERAISMAPSCGLEYVETRHTGMVNNQRGTDPNEGEVIVILRKP